MRKEPNRTKQNIIRQDKGVYIKAGQSNPIGRKESQEQAKESVIHLLALLGVQQKHQANSHNSNNIHAEDMVQTQTGLVFAASVLFLLNTLNVDHKAFCES